jgi:hypothetical protein
MCFRTFNCDNVLCFAQKIKKNDQNTIDTKFRKKKL